MEIMGADGCSYRYLTPSQNFLLLPWKGQREQKLLCTCQSSLVHIYLIYVTCFFSSTNQPRSVSTSWTGLSQVTPWPKRRLTLWIGSNPSVWGSLVAGAQVAGERLAVSIIGVLSCLVSVPWGAPHIPGTSLGADGAGGHQGIGWPGPHHSPQPCDMSPSWGVISPAHESVNSY